MAVSNEVWETARTIWENEPTISYQGLLDRLQELFGDKAPKNKSAISRKIKKDGWQVKTGIQTVEKQHQKATIEKSNTKKATKNPTNVDNKVIAIVNKTEQKVDKEMQRLVMTAQERVQIILKHRKRIKELGEYQDEVLSTAQSISDYSIDSEEDGEQIRKILILSKEMASTLNQLTSSQKLLAEQEFAICGITADDFTQSEQEKRLGALALLDGIADEEREARDRLKGNLMERLQWIEGMESGDD